MKIIPTWSRAALPRFHLNGSLGSIAYIRGSAEKVIGWPRYSHGIWPNEVYFLTYFLSMFHIPLGVLLGAHWFKRLSTVDLTLSYKLFNLSSYIYIYMCVCVCCKPLKSQFKTVDINELKDFWYFLRVTILSREFKVSQRMNKSIF